MRGEKLIAAFSLADLTSYELIESLRKCDFATKLNLSFVCNDNSCRMACENFATCEKMIEFERSLQYVHVIIQKLEMDKL